MSRTATVTVGEVLRRARQELISTSPSPLLDAQLLLAHVLGKSREWTMGHPEDALSPAQAQHFASLLQRRTDGEPVAYLRGYVEWLGMNFVVSPDVLIPRPETELLVEEAERLVVTCDRKSVLDVGTGSGCIALALARRFPTLSVTATERSAGPLRIAHLNAQRLGVADRVQLLRGDLLEPVPSPPDLLVANLPYVSHHEMGELPVSVRYEPVEALDGGRDGLAVYERLFGQLVAKGWRPVLALEIDPGQREAFRLSLETRLGPGRVNVITDYSGRDRVLTFEPSQAGSGV